MWWRTKREAGHVIVAHVEPVRTELGDGGVHAAGVEQHEGVEDEAEGADPILHAVLIVLVELPGPAVEDLPGECVAAFLEVGPHFDLPGRMDATGAAITFETVAREAGVSGSWLHNQPDLRAEIERCRARRRSIPAARPVPDRQRAFDASLYGAWRLPPSATDNSSRKPGVARGPRPPALGERRTPDLSGRRGDTQRKNSAVIGPCWRDRRGHRPPHNTPDQNLRYRRAPDKAASGICGRHPRPAACW